MAVVVLIVSRLVDHRGFSGEQQAGDRGGVGQRGAGDLHRIDDALSDKVAVFASGRVVPAALGQLGNLGDDDQTGLAAVLGDPAQRFTDALATMDTPVFSSPVRPRPR